jgi:hypothetical protein
MFDLGITQREIDYPYHGSLLHLSPVSDDLIELRDVDTGLDADALIIRTTISSANYL